MKRQLHRVSALCTDSRHRHELLYRSRRDTRNGLEACEKGLGCGDGDAGYGGQRQLGRRLWRPPFAARVDSMPTRLVPPARARRQPMDPKCGLGRIVGPKKRNPRIDDREKGATDGSRCQRASVQVGSFHEKVRSPTSSSEPENLWPEPTLDHGEVQVDDVLPLDQELPRHDVVTYRTRFHGDRYAELGECVDDPAALFVDVGDDTDDAHVRIVPSKVQRNSLRFLAKARNL